MARTGFASFHSKYLARCVFLEPFSREFGSIGKSCKWSQMDPMIYIQVVFEIFTGNLYTNTKMY